MARWSGLVKTWSAAATVNQKLLAWHPSCLSFYLVCQANVALFQNTHLTTHDLPWQVTTCLSLFISFLFVIFKTGCQGRVPIGIANYVRDNV